MSIQDPASDCYFPRCIRPLSVAQVSIGVAGMWQPRHDDFFRFCACLVNHVERLCFCQSAISELKQLTWRVKLRILGQSN